MIPLKDNIKTQAFPFMTLTLIIANVLMYFVFQKGGITVDPSNANVVNYGAIPWEFSHWGKYCQLAGQDIVCGVSSSHDVPVWLSALTSMFMHGSILHIGGNMIFLWVFGKTLEGTMGPILFLIFYLLGGFVALFAQVIVSPNSLIPTIGASGAIAAVLGGYILLFPHARILTLVFLIIIFPLVLPAVIVLGLWFLEQIALGAAGLGTPASGGVAYFAHIGGFIFGLVLVRIFAVRIRAATEMPSLR